MTDQNNTEQTDRREFLARTLKAGAGIAAATGLGYYFYDSQGPQPGPDTAEISLPDFSVEPQPGKVMSIVKGPDRSKTVSKAIELLGGIGRFIKKGDTVAIKPNVAFASPPVLGATTHPDLVGQVTRLCLKAGAKKVLVMDNPINDPASCFALSGIGQAARAAGAAIAMPQPDMFSRASLENGNLIRNWPVMYGPLSNVDKLIGITPAKDHHRSGASMTMKNWYGLLGGRRNIFHQDINTIITELSLFVKPTLVILDGTKVMMTNGPTGGSVSDLRQTNTLIASCDMVAADSYGATLMDKTASQLPWLAKAQRAGAGTTDYKSLKPVETSLS